MPGPQASTQRPGPEAAITLLLCTSSVALGCASSGVPGPTAYSTTRNSIAALSSCSKRQGVDTGCLIRRPPVAWPARCWPARGGATLRRPSPRPGHHRRSRADSSRMHSSVEAVRARCCADEPGARSVGEVEQPTAPSSARALATTVDAALVQLAQCPAPQCGHAGQALTRLDVAPQRDGGALLDHGEQLKGDRQRLQKALGRHLGSRFGVCAREPGQGAGEPSFSASSSTSRRRTEGGGSVLPLDFLPSSARAIARYRRACRLDVEQVEPLVVDEPLDDGVLADDGVDLLARRLDEHR